MNWDETQAQFYDKDSWIVLRRKEDKKQIGEGVLNLAKYANISLGKKAQDRLQIIGCEYDEDAYFEIAVTATEDIEEDPDAKKKRPNSQRVTKSGKGSNRNLSAAQISARSRQSVMEPIFEEEEEYKEKKTRKSENKRKRTNRSTTREQGVRDTPIDVVLYDETDQDKEAREARE